MQKKSSGLKAKRLKIDIEYKTKFWQPVVRNGWWLKFSTYRDHFILLMIVSQYTGQTIIRYYEDENEAVAFINFVTTCNANDILQSA
jgi:ABC-type molybdate transport system substrate-binding protein